MGSMQFSTGLANRLGNRASNQDRCLILEREDAVLLAVADGMGGHARGDLAAQAFVDTLGREFRHWDAQDTAKAFLEQAFTRANDAVLAAGRSQTPPITPLTTGVACLIHKGHASWGHVGDSRLYWLRNKHVEERTRDHTPVEDLVAGGIISEEQARSHPDRNYVNRCIGGSNMPPETALSGPHKLQRNDVLLLCSDGFWAALDEKSLCALSDTKQSFPDRIEALAEDAERATYPQSDNVSAVALRWICCDCPAVETRDRKPEKNTSRLPDPVDRAIATIRKALREYGPEMTKK